MKTILVTGANGFIGSHTLNYLQQLSDNRSAGINLIAACRDKTGCLTTTRVKYVKVIYAVPITSQHC